MRNKPSTLAAAQDGWRGTQPAPAHWSSPDGVAYWAGAFIRSRGYGLPMAASSRWYTVRIQPERNVTVYVVRVDGPSVAQCSYIPQ